MGWSPLGNEPLPDSPIWHSPPRGRGTFAIVSNSLITLSLCVWTVLHLNLPDQSEGKWQLRMRKPKWLFGGLVFPEYVRSVHMGPL